MEKEIKTSLKYELEPKKLIVIKRREPMKYDFLKGEAAVEYITEINRQIYFYKHFETRFEIEAGEVFLARFGTGVGNELSGNHYVMALFNSNPRQQLVRIVPLKSAKGKPLNPASDILIGKIENLYNSKDAIAIINQARAIDKRRLFDSKTIAQLSKYISSEMIGESSEITVQLKNVYRLTDEQYDKVYKAVIEFNRNSFIKHWKHKLVVF